MLGKVLPQKAEGDVFGDKGDCDAGHKSNQVGGENRRYPAIVVAEKRRFITVFVRPSHLSQPKKSMPGTAPTKKMD